MLHAHHGHVPNFGQDSTNPEDAHVKPGDLLVIDGEKTYRHIYVDGTGASKAIVHLKDGCTLKVQTILLNGQNAILQSGDGVACEVIWRDLPLNTTDPADYFDPEQLGNGLVNLSGEVYLRGKNPRSAKARLWKEIKAGDTTIDLQATPKNWQPGDRLCLPDTRQPQAESDVGAQTEYVVIKSMFGPKVTLTAPVTFSHLGLRGADGEVRELPDIGNLTQSIVFRSENPSGVRGHMIHMDQCKLDMAGYSLVDMGRTTTAPLHSTIWDAHAGPGSVIQLGTNQIGRYSDHEHGMPGREGVAEFQSYRRNFSIVGSPKLGFVKHHSTHFGYAEEFCIVDCAGADLVHETPQVYGNVYRNAFLCGKTQGSSERITDRAHRNAAGGDHWHGGDGLGLQSMMAEFHGISIYARKEGIGLAGFGSKSLWQPTKRGVHTETTDRVRIIQQHAAEKQEAYPFMTTSDVRVWGCWRGLETWTSNCWEDSPRMFAGLEIIHCRHPTDLNDQEETYLEGWRILGDYTQIKPVTLGAREASFGIQFKPGYRFGIRIVGGEISGHDAAYLYIMDDDYTRFEGVHIDCPLVAYHSNGRFDNQPGPSETKWLNCTWGSQVQRLMDGWYPKYDLKLWLEVDNLKRRSLEPTTYEVSPWKDGRKYRVFHYEQHPDFALPPIAADKAYGDWPPGVNTHKQLLERGLAIFGEAIPPGAMQRDDFGPFWALDISPVEPPPPVPLTLEQRVERLEREVFGEVATP